MKMTTHELAARRLRLYNKTRRDNTSGFVGVSWVPGSRKWSARAKINYREFYLGLFQKPEEAYKAYLKFIRRKFQRQ